MLLTLTDMVNPSGDRVNYEFHLTYAFCRRTRALACAAIAHPK